MSSSVDVSVIIPAYNVENSLGHAVDSVLEQTLSPREIIVVNDGSTDATARVAQGYGDRIKYVEQENLGQGAARNKALEIVSGKYVTFLDADDYWCPDFLECCVRFLESNRDAVVVFTAWTKRFSDGTEVILPRIAASRSIQKEGPQVLPSFYEFWARNNHVQTGTIMIRAEIISEAGGMRPDLRISQDLEYWAHIASYGKWGFIPRPLLVNTSEVNVPKHGWLRKYVRRRNLCPTVEQWESRIIGRIAGSDMTYFKIVRSRVAAGYMYAKIIAGDKAGAMHILEKYGSEMPVNKLTTWGKRALAHGRFSWSAFCHLIRFREYLKILR